MDTNNWNITVEGCDCPEGTCKWDCDPPSICVKRRARLGKVYVDDCPICKNGTWHFEGKCLACLHNEKKE
jgi:hypothetical protein